MGDFSWLYDDLATLTGDKSYLKKKPVTPPTLSSPTALTQPEIENVLRGAGWDERHVPKMAAIAMGESARDKQGRALVNSFNPGVGPGGVPTKEKSAGLFQVNLLAHPQYDKQKLMSDPTYAAKAALDIFNERKSKGQDPFGPWGAYTNGSYRQFYKGRALSQPQQGASGNDYSFVQNDLKNILGDAVSPHPDYSFVQDDLKKLGLGDIPTGTRPAPTNPTQTIPQSSTANIVPETTDALLQRLDQPLEAPNVGLTGPGVTTPLPIQKKGQKRVVPQATAQLPQGTVDVSGVTTDPAQAAAIKASEDYANQYNAQQEAPQPQTQTFLVHPNDVNLAKLIPVPTGMPEDEAKAYRKKVNDERINNGIADTFNVPKGLNEDQANQWINSQLQAKYGVSVPADRKALKGEFIPGGQVLVTFGDLKALGADVEPLMREKAIQQRVETVRPDLNPVGHDFSEDDAKDLGDLLVGGAKKASLGVAPEFLTQAFGKVTANGILDNLGAMGKRATMLAGMIRIAQELNPITNTAISSRTKNPVSNQAKAFADTLYKFLQETGENGARLAARSDSAGLQKYSTQIANDLVDLYIGAKALPEASTLFGRIAHGATLFGGMGGLASAGSGAPWQDVVKETAKQGAIGGAFGLGPAVGEGVATGVATLFNKPISNLLKEGVTVGTIGGGTYGIAKLAGDSDSQAWQQAITNSLFHVAPVIGQHLMGKTVELVGGKGQSIKVDVSKDGEIKVAAEDAKPDYTLPLQDTPIAKPTEPLPTAERPVEPVAEKPVESPVETSAAQSQSVVTKESPTYAEMSDEELMDTYHDMRARYGVAIKNPNVSERFLNALDQGIELAGNELSKRAGLPEGTMWGNRGDRVSEIPREDIAPVETPVEAKAEIPKVEENPNIVKPKTAGEAKKQVPPDNTQVYYNGKIVDMGYAGKPKEQLTFGAQRIADNLGTGGHTEDVGYVKTPDGKYYEVSRNSRKAKLLTGDALALAKTKFEPSSAPEPRPEQTAETGAKEPKSIDQQIAEAEASGKEAQAKRDANTKVTAEFRAQLEKRFGTDYKYISPEQLTQDEYLKAEHREWSPITKNTFVRPPEDLISEHKDFVEQALKEGRPVPENVLADYPDLKPKTQAPKTAAEAKVAETVKPKVLKAVAEKKAKVEPKVETAKEPLKEIDKVKVLNRLSKQGDLSRYGRRFQGLTTDAKERAIELIHDGVDPNKAIRQAKVNPVPMDLRKAVDRFIAETKATDADIKGEPITPAEELTPPSKRSGEAGFALVPSGKQLKELGRAILDVPSRDWYQRIKDPIDKMMAQHRAVRDIEFESERLKVQTERAMEGLSPDERIAIIDAMENDYSPDAMAQLNPKQRQIALDLKPVHDAILDYNRKYDVFEERPQPEGTRYMFHWWNDPNTGRPFSTNWGEFSKSGPSSKQRHIETYAEGRNRTENPLEMASTNPGEILGKSFEQAVRVKEARDLVDHLKQWTFTDPQGTTLKGIVSEPPKGLEDRYVELDIPALNRTKAIPQGDAVLLAKEPAYIVKELAPKVEAYFKHPEWGKIDEILSTIKSVKLAGTFFHGLGLMFKNNIMFRVRSIHDIRNGLKQMREMDDTMKILHRNGLDTALHKDYQDIVEAAGQFNKQSVLGKTSDWIIHKNPMVKLVFGVVRAGLKNAYAHDTYGKMEQRYLNREERRLGRPLTDAEMKTVQNTAARAVVKRADSLFSGEDSRAGALEASKAVTQYYFNPTAQRIWSGALISKTWQREHILEAKNLVKSLLMPRTMGPIAREHVKELAGVAVLMSIADVYNYFMTKWMDKEGHHLWNNPSGSKFSIRAPWNEPAYKNSAGKIVAGGPAYIRPFKAITEVPEVLAALAPSERGDIVDKLTSKLNPAWSASANQMTFTSTYKKGGLVGRTEQLLTDLAPIAATVPVNVAKGHRNPWDLVPWALGAGLQKPIQTKETKKR